MAVLLGLLGIAMLAVFARVLGPVSLPRWLAITSTAVTLLTLPLCLMVMRGSMLGDPPVRADGQRHQDPISILTVELSLIAAVVALWHVVDSLWAIWPGEGGPPEAWCASAARALFMLRPVVIASPFVLVLSLLAERGQLFDAASQFDGGLVLLFVLLVIPIVGVGSVAWLALRHWRTAETRRLHPGAESTP